MTRSTAARAAAAPCADGSPPVVLLATVALVGVPGTPAREAMPHGDPDPAGWGLTVGAVTPGASCLAAVRMTPPLVDGLPHSAETMDPSGAAADTHLCVGGETSGTPWWAECADVLIGGAAGCADAGTPHGVGPLLDRHPGALIAAVPHSAGGCVLGVRDGQTLLAIPGGGRRMCARRRTAFASFVHGWLVAGRPLGALRSVVLGAPDTATSAPPLSVHLRHGRTRPGGGRGAARGG
ncbi:hypothetical protein [Streptomyces inhibens]|uniref:hypothetical protein n=1 Tax=Streptomyces inhibens TaxID=2293571 RepID=UPI001EE69CB6|nr:hypothetical protein [Streptomyces inhibens]UKY53890.1 hypothetical protein KI385_37205 [Streptomyces inhibens]